MPPRVHVAVQRIDGDLAARAARADDRHLAVERHAFLVQQRHRRRAVPSARVGLRRRAHHRLALAVVAEAARLEHPGQADRRAWRASSCGARADGAPARGGNARRSNRRFSRPGPGRRRAPRAAGRCARRAAARRRAQRLDRDVLPVEGHDLAARAPGCASSLRSVNSPLQQRRDLAGRAHRAPGRGTGNRGPADSPPKRACGRAGRRPRCRRS